MSPAKPLLAVILLAAPLFGQTPAPPAFDVVSVKPNTGSTPANSNFPLGPGDAYTPNGGYFNATGFSAMVYIAFAYKLQPTQIRAIMDHAPTWISTERFDVQARVQGNPGKDEMRAMVRTLLADRFKLAMHEESRDTPVAAMVVAKEGKLGPQIQHHPAGTPCPKDAQPGPVAEDARFPLLCGGILQLQPSVPGRIRVAARDVTMDFIAKSLSAATQSGRPLIDATALTGTYDFNLEFTPELTGPVKPTVEEQLERSGPTFEAALREQLGIKLESRKAPLKVFVLDHIERPTEN